MTRLKRQASQELLPTHGPKHARRDSSVLSWFGESFTSAAKFFTSNASEFYEAAVVDVIPKPSHPPKSKSSPPPSRTPRRLARPPLPTEFRLKSQPSVATSPPRSSTPSPTRRPETTRSPPPVLPTLPQAHAPTDFPSSVTKQGSQESETSVESALLSSARKRKNGLKNHRISGLPTYYKSHKHIHEKRHKEQVRQSRKDQREEMLQTIYEAKRSKGFRSSYSDFESLLKYQQHLEIVGAGGGHLLASASKSDSHSKASTTPREQRRNSSPDFTTTELAEDFIRRLFQKAKKSLEGPLPKRPFVPSLDQIELAKKERDKEIDQTIRPKPSPLPPRLPDEAEAYVDELLKKRGTLSKAGREQVADKDIARLRPYQWLNDEIINFYGQLILSRSESQMKSSTPTPSGHCNGFIEGFRGKGKGKAVEKKPLLNVHYFNTFFWPKLTGEGYDKGRLAKWTKKFDLFSKDIILIPINHNNSHWTAAAINFRAKRIESYDSMGMDRSAVRETLRKYLNDEHLDKKKTPFDFTDWSFPKGKGKYVPQQENGYDCGVFTCQFLEALSRGEDFGFSQVDMPYLRRRMIWEIGNAKLRDDP